MEHFIFDTHAHYDDASFDGDRRKILTSLKSRGVDLVVNIGASLRGCKDTLLLTKEYDFIYGAIGIHPSDCGDITEEDILWIKKQAKAEEKILAIGEIGLDYHWPEPDHETQKKWFLRQMALAKELNLPIVVHSREAAKDTYDLMKEAKAEKIGGIVHCFSYGPEMAAKFLEMGFYIGIGGVLTFKNGRKLKEVAEMTPLSRIVLETDCPYLAPEPYRGRRNNSSYLRYVVEELASIKDVSEEEVVETTRKNGYIVYKMEEKGLV